MTAVDSAAARPVTVRQAGAPPVAVPASASGSDASVPELRRRELGAFLRSRRERMSPEQVGLPVHGRRRTPGLRREEVAQLAGVGVSWYTWLEQGRDINVSEQVLEAIARALLLDRHEAAHLFALAGRGVQASAAESACVTAAVRAVLAQLAPYPAAVVNSRFDLLAYNEPYRWLVDDLDEVAADDRNLLWLVFTHPSWRSSLADWDRSAAQLVAQYRAAMAEHMGEPAWKCLLKRLQAASAQFRALWDRHEVLMPESRTKRFRSPRAGLLQFDYAHLWIGRHAETRVTVYVPADEPTRERLGQLLPG